MELSRPFIRLPFTFDAGQLAAEAAALPNSAWMPHPSGMEGNSAAALISRDGGDNDAFDGRMALTPHLRKCAYTQQAMASFGEVLGRSRLMRLEPGCKVAPHVDFNYHWHTRVRIHIPVITDHAVIFHCGGTEVHMAAGECWIFNSWRRHQVVNNAAITRVHLVIDAAGSSRFWRLVHEMEALDPLSDATAIAERSQPVRFDPNWRGDIATERYNTAPVMAPGELDALAAALVRDFEAHPGNNLQLVEHYKGLLTDFCKDWREAWHLHGYATTGHKRYQALIDSLRRELDPNPRALVTASNEIGVNPIINQRLLAPALAPNQAANLLDR
ncbi:MAG: aspartyl/asparaginyl beta-hydroxylase domain-containing protein [Gammaproteobacteria bacterium]|nr:aspartyl/asparaginyl beta-hydroxylase domain-containing protein [Gammaproteobacteria bacterium]